VKALLCRLWFRATGGKVVKARRRNVRIISTTGTSNSADVIDTMTGESICKAMAITAIDIRMRPREPNTATLQIEFFEIECEVNPNHLHYEARHPITGRYERLRSIAFADGTRIDVSSGFPRIRIDKED
jgi:hypothetical protein